MEAHNKNSLLTPREDKIQKIEKILKTTELILIANVS